MSEERRRYWEGRRLRGILLQIGREWRQAWSTPSQLIWTHGSHS